LNSFSQLLVVSEN